MLSRVEIDGKIRYYIGQKDLCKVHLPAAVRWLPSTRVRDQRGVIGILGPVRMDYGYNTVAFGYGGGYGAAWLRRAEIKICYA